MGKIKLEGLHFYAYHGHFEVEQVVGNEFLIDLTIEADTLKAAKSDDLNDAVNYQAVYETVKKEMKVKSKLLENVAQRILDKLHQNFPEIEKAQVKISKLNPSMGGKIEKASVIISS